jgi:hypothetical protein
MDFNINCPNLHVEGFGKNWISEILETTLNFFAGLLRPSFLIALQFVERSETGKQRLQNFNTPTTCYKLRRPSGGSAVTVLL